MLAHVGQAQFHGDGDASWRHDLLDQTEPCARLNPLAEIMIATLVAVYLAIVITQLLKPSEVVLPTLAAVRGGKSECATVLDQSGAIEALQVDGKMFRFVLNLQRMSHIRTVHELVSIEESKGSPLPAPPLGECLCSEFQEFDDSKAVLFSIAYIVLC